MQGGDIGEAASSVACGEWLSLIFFEEEPRVFLGVVEPLPGIGVYADEDDLAGLGVTLEVVNNLDGLLPVDMTVPGEAEFPETIAAHVSPVGGGRSACPSRRKMVGDDFRHRAVQSVWTCNSCPCRHAEQKFRLDIPRTQIRRLLHGFKYRRAIPLEEVQLVHLVISQRSMLESGRRLIQSLKLLEAYAVYCTPI